MSMYLTYTIGKDERKLVDDVTDFHLDQNDYSNPQWLQARQNEDGMRQVFVTVKNEDGSPFNLTGCNYWFQGKLPDGIHKIIDAKHGVTLDAQNGKFRFDMPKQAFTVAGSYVQAFFRIVRDGESITTLEFDLTVLADLVYNDLVPSDYITPFEDLYGKLKDYITKANGDFEAAMTQWRKDVADLITELNADIGGINLTITEIKSQLSALEDKIKADGLFTKADADALIANLTKIVDEAINKFNENNEFELGSHIDIGGEIGSDLSTQTADFIKKIEEDDNFKILVVTDSHYEEIYNQNNYTYPYGGQFGLSHLNAVNEVAKHVNLVVSGGDNINGLNGEIKHSIGDLSRFSDKILFTGSNADAFMILGNHDDNSAQIRYGNISNDDVMSEEIIESAFQTQKRLSSETRNKNSLYFFKDYDQSKIRFIGLNSFDTPDDVRAKYPRYFVSSYGDTQLNWLANTALATVPAGYNVVLFSHAPLPYGFTPSPETSWYNHDLLEGLLNAFSNKTTYSAKSIDGTPDELKASVTADFSNINANLVGLWSGHVHIEKIVPVDSFKQCLYLADVNQVENNMGTSNEAGFAVASIDAKNRQVNIYGFGRATDRQYAF